MHDKKFLLLVVAILGLFLAPVAVAQDQEVAQDQTGLQQRARDQILIRDPLQDPDARQDADVEIAHNDAIDEDGNVTHDDRVRVETVFSNGPGWLVVYAASGGQDQVQAEDGLRVVAQCGVAALDGQDADAEGQAVTGEQPLARFGIVGYAPLQNGVNRNIEVPVDASRAARVLCLAVHHDAGEIGAFEYPSTDAPATGGLLVNVIGGLLDQQGQLIVDESTESE